MANMTLRKPDWLQKRIRPSVHQEMQSLLDGSNLNTICHEAMCPNITECYQKKVATFMIMGTICTRFCTFCNVHKGKPNPLDEKEPENIAKAVKTLELKHVVITSPTRDDLIDGGALHFVNTVAAIKKRNKETKVELLIPDMQENADALKLLAHSNADIIGHNLETVPSLYHVRKGANYRRSLRVLQIIKEFNKNVATKSAIMLGLGEKESEVKELMQDLLDVGCSYLSIGQYLAPSQNHEKVAEYVEPSRFSFYHDYGISLGFAHIQSSPYTRSSYMAHQFLEVKNEAL